MSDGKLLKDTLSKINILRNWPFSLFSILHEYIQSIIFQEPSLITFQFDDQKQLICHSITVKRLLEIVSLSQPMLIGNRETISPHGTWKSNILGSTDSIPVPDRISTNNISKYLYYRGCQFIQIGGSYNKLYILKDIMSDEGRMVGYKIDCFPLLKEEPTDDGKKYFTPKHLLS